VAANALSMVYKVGYYTGDVRTHKGALDTGLAVGVSNLVEGFTM